MSCDRGLTTLAFRAPEPPVIDPQLLDLVTEYTLGRVEKARRFGAIAARRLERILNHVRRASVEGVAQ